MYYLSTKNIEAAYRALVKLKFTNQSILHIFFILKGIGIDALDFKNLDIIKQKGLMYAQDLSSLFSDFEVQPEKCDFINPFMMDTWGTNPTEKLKKWVEARVKNNIVGGATTWRKIITQDINENFKFTYDYLNQIYDMVFTESKKIPLIPLSIWALRFTAFDKKISVSELCKYFIARFNITLQEKDKLFETKTQIEDIEFREELFDTSAIRKLIGAPKDLKNWISITKNTEKINLMNTTLRRYNMETTNNITGDLLTSILDNYFQLILSGPPGTSKSFLCADLSKNYDKCLHVQFHPQYTYQQFVGGYLVEGSNVVYKKGVFLNLIDEALKNNSKKYLLIIDEINRANTSQVFGDLIQCLDRGNSIELLIDGKLHSITIPKNIHIVATMNTTDRTLGLIDYALRRRFLEVYCGSNPNILLDLCPNKNFISLAEFLERLNKRLFENLKNRDMCIGHALFLNNNFQQNGQYIWDFKKLEVIFNYKILPLIEEYCYGNFELINEILGSELPKRLSGEDFKNQIENFMR